MQDNDSSLPDKKFYAAWKILEEEFRLSFQMCESELEERPLATKQIRYLMAITALTKFLLAVDEDETAEHFHFLALAMTDLVEGVSPSLFKIEGPVKKPGRTKDNAAVWMTRSSLCVGIEYLVAGGMKPNAAIDSIVRKHRKELVKLQRPGADISSSLRTWRKSFSNDLVNNDTALSRYKTGVARLNSVRAEFSKTKIRFLGDRLVAGAAGRASRLPSTANAENVSNPPD